MHGIIHFNAEFHLHEETHIMTLSMVLYEKQRFFTLAIVRVVHNLFSMDA